MLFRSVSGVFPEGLTSPENTLPSALNPTFPVPGHHTTDLIQDVNTEGIRADCHETTLSLPKCHCAHAKLDIEAERVTEEVQKER